MHSMLAMKSGFYIQKGKKNLNMGLKGGYCLAYANNQPSRIVMHGTKEY